MLGKAELTFLCRLPVCTCNSNPKSEEIIALLVLKACSIINTPLFTKLPLDVANMLMSRLFALPEII